MTNEFPILHAAAAPSSAHTIKNQQTDAQRQATKLLRQKFKYPTSDPEPNLYRDTRTELQKIESILRTTSQILDQDQLSIWNEITERNLHLSQAHNSGIPLVKNDITEQIKTYRIDEEHKKSLLNKIKAFDNLHVQERLPDFQNTSDIAPTPSETIMPTEDEERPIDSEISSEILATSSSPDILSPPVLSTTISQLWMDDTTCHFTLVSILKLYKHICLSAIHCLLPYLPNTKIFSRILRKWDRFSPARRFRIKIANLLVRHNLISSNLLKRRAKLIDANFQSGNKASIQCRMNNVSQICCLDSGAHNSIISAQVFDSMNIDRKKLCTRQTYNIKTATALETDAVQGTVVLDLTIYNEDNTAQTVKQPFLVLRPQLSLSIPLLGLDFLTNNQVVMIFTNGKFMVKVNGFKLSLSLARHFKRKTFCLLTIQV